MAIEDEHFYEHGGIDYGAIVRAGWEDLKAGAAVQGGSTITQQLVRNLYIADPEETIERKIREATWAEEYEQKYSKRPDPHQVPEHGLLRDHRRPHRGRRPGRRRDLLLEAGVEASTCPRRR